MFATLNLLSGASFSCTHRVEMGKSCEDSASLRSSVTVVLGHPGTQARPTPP